MNGSEPQKWIVIVDWHRFQHYKDRWPPWIKNYCELLHDPEYLDLPEGTRSLLHGLWLIYASSHARVPLDTRSLSRQLQLRVTMAQLERLRDAGFIEFSASAPLSDCEHDASPHALARAEQREVQDQEQDLDVVRDQTKEPATAEQPANHTPPNGNLNVDRELHAFRLASILPDKDEGTMTVLRALARELPQAAFETVYEKVRDSAPKSPAAYAVAELNRMKRDGQYA